MNLQPIIGIYKMTKDIIELRSNGVTLQLFRKYGFIIAQ